MKKNILIHIGSLNAGGAEKSLISLLNQLPKELYNIDLLLLRNEGLFKNLLPSHIRVVPAEFPYQCLTISIKNIKYYLLKSPIYLWRKLCSLIKTKLVRRMSADQIRWNVWKDIIGTNKIEYDVAISFLEGVPNYYVIDKVQAKRKILWVHNEYSKLGYNRDFDLNYFAQADAVVTISDLCLADLQKNFHTLSNKFQVIENITDPLFVKNMADIPISDDQFESEYSGISILSIGRLHPQKNFELAIDAAALLKDRGLKYKWYIIGEGELRSKLQSKIDKMGLTDCFKLLGLRCNPYQYMKQCNVIVQSSLYEGKSIVLDEAKILCKPIVATNYSTVYNVLNDHYNGIITDMTPLSLADGIHELIENPIVCNQIISNLESEPINNIAELQKYIHLIDTTSEVHSMI